MYCKTDRITELNEVSSSLTVRLFMPQSAHCVSSRVVVKGLEMFIGRHAWALAGWC